MQTWFWPTLRNISLLTFKECGEDVILLLINLNFSLTETRVQKKMQRTDNDLSSYERFCD